MVSLQRRRFFANMVFLQLKLIFLTGDGGFSYQMLGCNLNGTLLARDGVVERLKQEVDRKKTRGCKRFDSRIQCFQVSSQRTFAVIDAENYLRVRRRFLGRGR